MIKHILVFFVSVCLFYSCDSVGTYKEADHQLSLDNAHILRRNLQNLIANYKEDINKTAVLCTDSIKKHLKIEDGKVNLSIIDIYSLNQLSKGIKNPVLYLEKAPNVFYYCVRKHTTSHGALLAYSFINESDTIWEKAKEKNAALDEWLVTLDEWSDLFWDGNVAVFYPLDKKSRYPKVSDDGFEPGILTGYLILIDWPKLSPVCTIPCSVTNSNEIEFKYTPGTANVMAYEKLKTDLMINLESHLVNQFYKMGIESVKELSIHY